MSTPRLWVTLLTPRRCPAWIVPQAFRVGSRGLQNGKGLSQSQIARPSHLSPTPSNQLVGNPPLRPPTHVDALPLGDPPLTPELCSTQTAPPPTPAPPLAADADGI